MMEDMGVDSCAGSYEPSAGHPHEQDDADFTRRCPVCGHAVEVHPVEPGGEDVWRFVGTTPTAVAS